MNTDLLTLLGIIFGGGGFFTAYIALRKLKQEKLKLAAETRDINARATGEEVDTLGGIRQVLEQYQVDTQRLYKENASLQKENAELIQKLDLLQDRLKVRDSQLATLQKLAEDSQIVAVVNSQLSAMNVVIANLEEARSEAVELLKAQTKQVTELVQTNRDLSLKKPPKE